MLEIYCISDYDIFERIISCSQVTHVYQHPVHRQKEKKDRNGYGRLDVFCCLSVNESTVSDKKKEK